MAVLNEHKVVLLVGPTAVGKTELSLSLTETLRGEIVSCDSRQVYRYMDIGTAKPTPAELARAPHHFIDVRDPDDYYSAGHYGEEARGCIDQLFERDKPPVVVGGSGFYIQALVDGLFAPRLSNPAVKEKWRRRIAEEGIETVFDYLRRVDPVTAGRLHANDLQRVVRALEVFDLSDTPISQFRQGDAEPAEFNPVFIGLYRDRQNLYERINRRVDAMLEQGLLDEVRALRERGYSPSLNALRTVGYREVFQYFEGELTFDEMVEKIKQNTRRYAKRQLTWFRKDERIHWLNIETTFTLQAIDKISHLL